MIIQGDAKRTQAEAWREVLKLSKDFGSYPGRTGRWSKDGSTFLNEAGYKYAQENGQDVYLPYILVTPYSNFKSNK